MSLIAFHRFLIASAILFCFGYAAWELVHFWVTGAGGSLALGLVFVILGVLLSIYLARLRRYVGYRDEGEPEAG